MEPGAGMVAAVIATLVVVQWNSRRERKVRQAGTADDAGAALERADLLVLQGAWSESEKVARQVAAHYEGERGSRGVGLRVRALLLLAESEAGLNQEDDAARTLERAAEARTRLFDEETARELEALERLIRVLIGRPGEATAAGGSTPEELLDEALAAPPRPEEASRLIRLARLAVWRGERDLREGSWPRARAHFEHAVRLGESVPAPGDAGIGDALERARLRWTLARSRASAAAGEIGLVLASLGEREQALGWLDQSVATIEAAELPAGRIALARALIARAMHEPADPVLGFEPRAGRLIRARDTAAACDWPAARALAARAEIHLGVLRTQEGASEAAAALFRAAQQRMEGLGVAGAAGLSAEALLLLGHLLEDRGDLDDARVEYRRAFDAGRADADPDARRLAAIAGCHLHRLLHHADRTGEARALLEPLEALPPTLAPPARPLVAAMVARCRGHQHFRDGEREAAEGVLQRASELVGAIETPEAADLTRQIAAERGNLALAGGQPAEAESHFRRALATAKGSRPEPVEQAERAEIRLHLVQALLNQGRGEDAKPELKRVFESGRDSGRANGRSAAAAAAMLLGDHPEATLDERRRWYESATRFGKLSGTPRGLQVVEAVAQRLRELTE